MIPVYNRKESQKVSHLTKEKERTNDLRLLRQKEKTGRREKKAKKSFFGAKTSGLQGRQILA